MIFVVVGTQEPFDRLIKWIDVWSAKTGYHDILAQIADSSYKPRNFDWFDFMPINQFDEKFKEAHLIVSHAGMGTIISALQFNKPIIVMPRLAKFKEHRNDHQLATANSFSQAGYVKSVYSEEELYTALINRNTIKPVPPISTNASEELIGTIRDFLSKNIV